MKQKSSRRSILIGLFVGLAISICSPSMLAGTTTWTGNGDGIDWFDGGNWDNDVPDSSIDAFINNGQRR
jgi:hypothetical protein